MLHICTGNDTIRCFVIDGTDENEWSVFVNSTTSSLPKR